MGDGGCLDNNPNQDTWVNQSGVSFEVVAGSRWSIGRGCADTASLSGVIGGRLLQVSPAAPSNKTR